MASCRTIAISALLAFAAVASSGQGQVPQAKTVITFAAVSTIDTPGAVAVVIRRASGQERNLILLRAGKATIGDVALSLGTLADRQSHELRLPPGGEERTTVKAGHFSTFDHDQVVRFNNILISLRQARSREVRGLGSVPAIDVPLRVSRQ